MRISNNINQQVDVDVNDLSPGTVFKTELGGYLMVIQNGQSKLAVNLQSGNVVSLRPHFNVKVVDGAALTVEHV